MLHRGLSLLAVSLVASHVAAAPILKAGADAVVPYALSLGGSYRVSDQLLGDLRLDSDGDGQASEDELYGQDHLVEHRLRFEPKLELFNSITIDADIQLAQGYLSVDTPNRRFNRYGPPRDGRGRAFGDRQVWADQLKVRKLYMTWKMPIGAILIGRMASSWGAGILANSGDDDLQDWGAARFGEDRNYGDVVNRLLFVTAPFIFVSNAPWARRWQLALGGDVVERDERIDLSKGDVAKEGIGALRYSHKNREGGVYIAYRDLRDRNEDTLQVWAFDVFGKGTWRFGDLEAYGMGEIAHVIGKTTWGQSSGYTGLLDVKQLGYVARVGATWLPLGIGADVEVGYASGDSNPVDDKLRNFTFDPDYNPSLIMFEELRAAETVAAQANASDTARLGYPPNGARLLPTNGSVTNAVYLRPTVRYKWQDFQARVALLWARAEESVVDPYYLNAWSVEQNFQGGDAGERDLGYEINLGIDYKHRFQDWVDVVVSVQRGRLVPGKAFDNGAGQAHPPVDVFFGRLVLRWLPPAQAE